jgi:dTDP-4-dehydrorhamnose reductase
MRRAAAWGEEAPQAERLEQGEGPPRLKKMRVLVTGARGQLAGAIIEAYKESAQVLAYSREELDIADLDAVMARTQADRPDVIINCAAYTNVDGAEDEADKALTANAFAVRVLARAAQEVGATLVHYSTDFVFDGKTARPYTEDDVPNPQSAYGQSKLLGEWFALEAPRAFVLRVESLFGGANAKSSIDRIAQAIVQGREAKVFRDRVVSPSYVVDVAAATKVLVVGGEPGLYHCVGTGYANWHEVGLEIARVMGKERDALLQPVSVADVSLRAQRPQFAALANDKLARVFPVPTWQDALRRYLSSQ